MKLFYRKPLRLFCTVHESNTLSKNPSLWRWCRFFFWPIATTIYFNLKQEFKIGLTTWVNEVNYLSKDKIPSQWPFDSPIFFSDAHHHHFHIVFASTLPYAFAQSRFCRVFWHFRYRAVFEWHLDLPFLKIKINLL